MGGKGLCFIFHEARTSLQVKGCRDNLGSFRTASGDLLLYLRPLPQEEPRNWCRNWCHGDVTEVPASSGDR